MATQPEEVDVIIVGGGPAGLSAALVLGRSNRSVVVVDAGQPRNRWSPAAHGLFSRDGAAPDELLRTARAQLAPYPVRVVDDKATAATRVDDRGADGGGFDVVTGRHGTLRGKKLLLATGLRDVMPALPAPASSSSSSSPSPASSPTFADLLGRGVYVCPYCDGWEHRADSLVVYGTAALGPDLAFALLTYGTAVTLIVDTRTDPLDDDVRARLLRNDVVIVDDGVVALQTRDDHLAAVVLASGRVLPTSALFVHFGVEQASPLPASLGCTITDLGVVPSKRGERTDIPGVFVAGDASDGLSLIAIAVAEGVRAACAINTELRHEQHR